MKLQKDSYTKKKKILAQGPERKHSHIVWPTWLTKGTKETKKKLCSGTRLSIPSPETEIKTEGIVVLLQHIIVNTCKITREEIVS